MATKLKLFITAPLPRAATQILIERNIFSLFDVLIWENDELNLPLDKISNSDAILWMFGSNRGDANCDVSFINCAGPMLKVVSTLSVGYDHIDVALCKSRGIKVGNTPGVLTEATAELTIALLLATTRRLFEANRAISNSEWGLWSSMWRCGTSLVDSTIGIVGMGRIGLSVAEKLISFKPRQIMYHNRSISEKGEKIGAKLVPLSALLQSSDFVIITCALTDQTTGLLGEKQIGLMKPSAVLINTSRGSVVDQDALIKALKEGKIKAAGLDVTTPEPLSPDHELMSLPNCIVLPHVGSSTDGCLVDMTELAIENILAVFDGRSMPAEVI